MTSLLLSVKIVHNRSPVAWQEVRFDPCDPFVGLDLALQGGVEITQLWADHWALLLFRKGLDLVLQANGCINSVVIGR
jgi:hypothetical protein